MKKNIIVGAVILFLIILMFVSPAVSTSLSVLALILGVILLIVDAIRKKPTTIWKIFVGSAFLIIIVSMVYGISQDSKQSAYEDGVKALQEKNYVLAAQKFKEVEGYENADSLLSQAEKGLVGVQFDGFIQELSKIEQEIEKDPFTAKESAEGKLKAYYSAFQKKGTYGEGEVKAKAVIAKASAFISEKLNEYIAQSKAKFESGDLEGARALLLKIKSARPDSKDAQELLQQVQEKTDLGFLTKGEKLLGKKDYELAIKELEQISAGFSKRKDADDLLARCRAQIQEQTDLAFFIQGKKLLGDKDFGAALKELEQISAGFSKREDVDDLLSRCKEQIEIARIKEEKIRKAAEEEANATAEFVKELSEYNDAYNKEKNDIQKSQLYNGARDFEEKFFRKHKIKDWKGWVTTISTNKGGEELFLTVKIGSKELLGFSVSFKQGMGVFEKGISSSSPVYDAAAELKEGDCVLFSGKVIEEGSETENGAMYGPEYVFRFSSLRPCM